MLIQNHFLLKKKHVVDPVTVFATNLCGRDRSWWSTGITHAFDLRFPEKMNWKEKGFTPKDPGMS